MNDKVACPVCNGTGEIGTSIDKIAERRASLGLSRYELSSLSGVSNVTIGNLERRLCKPRASTIKSLLDALDRCEEKIKQEEEKRFDHHGQIIVRRGNDEKTISGKLEEGARHEEPNRLPNDNHYLDDGNN